MALSRKHFKELADILKTHDADPVMVRDIADFCYSHNSWFDRERFYEASGLTDL